MNLDHISYVVPHDQLLDEVQRIGARLGSGFIDGGIHPRFGTRNFTLPLFDDLYLEIVCPLDHPAADTSPFGRAVSQRANSGGGWLTWVLAVPDITMVEKKLNRNSVAGHRSKPSGIELKWKQIGVLGTIQDRQLPFFVEWESKNHPSKDEKPISSVTTIEIAGNKELISNWVGDEFEKIQTSVNFSWKSPEDYSGENGIISVTFSTPTGVFKLE